MVIDVLINGAHVVRTLLVLTKLELCGVSSQILSYQYYKADLCSIDKTIRTSASCNAPKPIGYEVGTDKIAYAIVSNGGVLTVKYGGQSAPINLGLNYGEFDIVSGSQRMELWEGSTLKQVANGGRGTYDYCVDGIYNMNPEVCYMLISSSG